MVTTNASLSDVEIIFMLPDIKWKWMSCASFSTHFPKGQPDIFDMSNNFVISTIIPDKILWCLSKLSDIPTSMSEEIKSLNLDDS